MAWYSILPDHLTILETWIIRFFLFLGLLNIAPWVLAVAIDLALYIVRQILYEIPVYGGRAQGQHRPRAPSIPDRARRRTMSLVGIVTGGSPGAIRRRARGQSGVGVEADGAVLQDDED